MDSSHLLSDDLRGHSLEKVKVYSVAHVVSFEESILVAVGGLRAPKKAPGCMFSNVKLKL